MVDVAGIAPALSRKAPRRWLRWSVAGLCLCAAAVGGFYSLHALYQRRLLRDCDQVVAWVRATHPLAGKYPGLKLPPALRGLSDPHDGTVDAVVLPDGRVFVLIRNSIGIHHNWWGFIHASAPLLPSEIGKDAYGRPQILIDGLDENFVDEKVNDRHYNAGFDLG